MPLISTEGNLIFEQISSIAVVIFFVSLRSITILIPFLAISMNVTLPMQEFLR